MNATLFAVILRGRKNKKMFTLKEIVAATQGILIHGDENKGVKGVSINTRTLQKGDLFIAIEGQKFDGHDFLSRSVKKGASALLVAKKNKNFLRKINSRQLNSIYYMHYFYYRNKNKHENPDVGEYRLGTHKVLFHLSLNLF